MAGNLIKPLARGKLSRHGILPPSCVGYWPMLEGAGTATARNYTQTPGIDLTFSAAASWTTGPYGPAVTTSNLSATLTSASSLAPYASLGAGAGCTIAVFATVPSAAISGFGVILGAADYFRVYLEGGGVPVVRTVGAVLTGTISVPVGSPFVMGATWQIGTGGSINVYVNQDNAGQLTTSDTSVSDVFKVTLPNNNAAQQIHAAACFARALSAAEWRWLVRDWLTGRFQAVRRRRRGALYAAPTGGGGGGGGGTGTPGAGEAAFGNKFILF